MINFSLLVSRPILYVYLFDCIESVTLYMAYGVIINVQETVNICTQSSGYRALYKEQENQEYFFLFS